MRSRPGWMIAAIALLVAGAMALYLRSDAAAACDSDEALGQVYALLRDRFHLQSVFLNDIRAVSGGYFGDRRDCSAEVTEIRGNVAASSMPWRAVRYRIVRQHPAPSAVVSVELGGDRPLAPRRPSFWMRVLAYL
ncbi:MAG TPA: hypothetical protein VMB34_17355 [Acetobacteraceae bacterium]|nr:hypothetical protein [Acetobacteraceae bacterium]